MIKHYLLSVLNLFLIVGCLLTMNDWKHQQDRRYELIVNAFTETEKGFSQQNEKIEQYKRDCENITQKVINGEW